MKITAKNICICGIIAAAYVILTFTCAPFAFGPIQVRPSEALTILPLLFVEAVPGLFVGCLIANIVSPFGIWDMAVGSCVTLIAAILTRLLRNVFLGGLPPVLLNAFLLPVMWFLSGSGAGYWVNVVSILLCQFIWVYGLGLPLYFTVKKLKPRFYGVQKTKPKNIE